MNRRYLTLGYVVSADDSQPIQTVQVEYDGDAVQTVNHLQSCGVRFVPASGECLLAFSDGDPGNPVALGVTDSEAAPPADSAAGTGGLHLVGTYKVFLAADGTVVLAGDSDTGRAATDAAVPAGALLTELNRLKSELDAVKADITTIQTHTHPVATTGTAAAQTGTAAASPDLAAVPTVSPASPGPVSSTTVKIPSEVE